LNSRVIPELTALKVLQSLHHLLASQSVTRWKDDIAKKPLVHEVSSTIHTSSAVGHQKLACRIITGQRIRLPAFREQRSKRFEQSTGV
jgi:hypothetical protein